MFLVDSTRMLVIASPSDTESLGSLERPEQVLEALRDCLDVLGPHPVMRVVWLSRALVDAVRDDAGHAENAGTTGDRRDATDHALTLVDAAEQIRDRSAPRGVGREFTRLAYAGSLLVDAFAAMLDPTQPDGSLSTHERGGWHFSSSGWGALDVTRGGVDVGFAARIQIIGEPRVTLCFGDVALLSRELDVHPDGLAR